MFYVQKDLAYFRRHAGATTVVKEYDGRNVIGDRMVYDEMMRLGHINALARMLGTAKRRKEYMHRTFNTEEIRDKAFRLWGITESNRKSTLLLARLCRLHRKLVWLIDSLLHSV